MYGWATSQRLPVDGFDRVNETSTFNEDYLNNNREDIVIGYFSKVDIKCSKQLYKTHNDLPFFTEKLKTKKCKKLLGNLYNKKEIFLHVRTLKQL